jgi:hypothetical protein
MRQHHGSIVINLNGLLANCSACCSKEKMHINVVVIGHVDSGKSTTTGKPPNSLDLRLEHRAHIHNRSLDLQVRRYRQAYHREVREGKNISSLLPCLQFLPYRDFAPRWGKFASHNQQNFLRPDIFGTTTSVACCPTIPIISTPHHFSRSNR